MELKELAQNVEKTLSPLRFRHTQGVVETAKKLASRYQADETKAEIAAWIHDVAREWPQEKLAEYTNRIDLPSGFAVIPGLLHGPVAANLLKEKYGFDDEDTANAIRYHTTGRVGMSTLEKIICLSDAIEPGRDYPEVQELRRAAEVNLNLALAKSLDSVMMYLIHREAPIFPLTVMARNDLWEQFHS